MPFAPTAIVTQLFHEYFCLSLAFTIQTGIFSELTEENDPDR